MKRTQKTSTFKMLKNESCQYKLHHFLQSIRLLIKILSLIQLLTQSQTLTHIITHE